MSLIISKAKIEQHEPLEPQYLNCLRESHKHSEIPAELCERDISEHSMRKHELPWRLANLSDVKDTQSEIPCSSNTFEVITPSPHGFNDVPTTVLTNLPIPPTLPLYYMEFEPEDKMNFEFFAGVTSVKIPGTETVGEIHDPVGDLSPSQPQSSERNRTISLLLGELIDSDNIAITFGTEDIDEDIQDFSEYRYGYSYDAEEGDEEGEITTGTVASSERPVGAERIATSTEGPVELGTEEATEEDRYHPVNGDLKNSYPDSEDDENIPEIDFDGGLFSSVTGDETDFPMSLCYRHDLYTNGNSKEFSVQNANVIKNTKNTLIKDNAAPRDDVGADTFALQINQKRKQQIKFKTESTFSSMPPDLSTNILPKSKSPFDHQIVHASYYWHKSNSDIDEVTFQVGPQESNKICYLDARSAIYNKRDPYRTRTQIPQPLHRLGIIVDTQKGEVNYTANGILLEGTTRWVEASRMKPGGRANFPYIAAYGGKYTAHFGDRSKVNDGFSFDIQFYLHCHERAKTEAYQNRLLEQSKQLMWDYFYLYGYGNLRSENDETEKTYQVRKQIRQEYSLTKDLTRCYDICSRNHAKLSPRTEFLYQFCQFVSATDDLSNPELALQCARKLSTRNLTDTQKKLVVNAAQLLGAPRPLTKELAFFFGPQFSNSVISGMEKDLSDSKHLQTFQKLRINQGFLPEDLL